LLKLGLDSFESILVEGVKVHFALLRYDLQYEVFVESSFCVATYECVGTIHTTEFVQVLYQVRTGRHLICSILRTGTVLFSSGSLRAKTQSRQERCTTMRLLCLFSSSLHCLVGLKIMLPLVIVAAAALILQPASAGTSDHRYKKGEHVELWVNKVRLK
jgi:hypothetical protein